MGKITSYARQQHHGVSNPLSGATVPVSNDHTDGSWTITDIYDRELMINTGNGKLQYRAGNDIYTLSPSSGDTGQTGSITIDLQNVTEVFYPAIKLIPSTINSTNAAIVCDSVPVGGISYSKVDFAAGSAYDGLQIGTYSGLTYPDVSGPYAQTYYATINVITTVSDLISISEININPSNIVISVDDGTDNATINIEPKLIKINAIETSGIVTLPAGGGTVTVNSSGVQAASPIFITPQSVISSSDFFYVDNKINSTSFDITSINTLGSAVDVAWYILN